MFVHLGLPIREKIFDIHQLLYLALKNLDPLNREINSHVFTSRDLKWKLDGQLTESRSFSEDCSFGFTSDKFCFYIWLHLVLFSDEEITGFNANEPKLISISKGVYKRKIASFTRKFNLIPIGFYVIKYDNTALIQIQSRFSLYCCDS